MHTPVSVSPLDRARLWSRRASSDLGSVICTSFSVSRPHAAAPPLLAAAINEAWACGCISSLLSTCTRGLHHSPVRLARAAQRSHLISGGMVLLAAQCARKCCLSASLRQMMKPSHARGSIRRPSQSRSSNQDKEWPVATNMRVTNISASLPMVASRVCSSPALPLSP